MPLWITTEFRIARLIGQGKFDDAIALVQRTLTGTGSDINNIEAIAQFHRWAERDEQATQYAKRALAIDPNSFTALSVMGDVLADRDEHEAAAQYVRRALENFPEPLPEIPVAALKFSRLVGRLIPRFGKASRALDRLAADPHLVHRDWYEWAKQYLSWYDAVHGQGEDPPVH